MIKLPKEGVVPPKQCFSNREEKLLSETPTRVSLLFIGQTIPKQATEMIEFPKFEGNLGLGFIDRKRSLGMHSEINLSYSISLSFSAFGGFFFFFFAGLEPIL